MDIVRRTNMLLGFALTAFIILVFIESFPKQEKGVSSSKSYIEKSRNTAVADDAVKKIFSEAPPFAGLKASPVPDTPFKPGAQMPLLYSLESGGGKYNIAHGEDLKEPLKPLPFRIKEGKNFWVPPPEGFFSAVTENYLIYREQMQVGNELKTLLDKLYANFYYDVMPFSVFIKFNKIFLMMFRTKESYSAYTNRPAWSAATTNIASGSIYIMEYGDFKSTVIHELSHIFYDGFFLPQTSPLWLSEGFAVYMQTLSTNEGKPEPWLENNLNRLANGTYIDFEEFTSVENLKGYSKEDVSLWYSQAFSVVRFLIKKQSKDGFYQFSKNIKEGMPLGKALFRTYGMPYNTLSALEYSWHADLQRERSR